MQEDQFFNINSMLKNIFQYLDQNCNAGRANLIFVFSKTVPCQLKGNSSTLYMVLVKIMRQVLEHHCSEELVIEVDAPADFLYKEPVVFKIENIPVKKDVIMPQLYAMLSEDLEILNASLEYTEDNGGSIEFTVPLTTAELGCRRYYRLPSKTMLHKNILLVVESNNLALSLTKMFRYFPMNIDLCIKHFNSDKYDLSQYDLVLIEDTLFDFQLHDLVAQAKEKSDIDFILLGNEDIYSEDDTSKLHTGFLAKPVTQESVYDLLVDQFDELPIVA